MNTKTEIVFTFPACIGGVSSFNYNIINNSYLKNKFYTKVILLKAIEDTRPMFMDKFEVDETIVFKYSTKENQYYVKKRLSLLLGHSDGCVVTDNYLTVEAVKQFQIPKTVFHLIHDYFYVNQNNKLGELVDVAIAHSSFFSDAVFSSNPEAFKNRSFYIPYGVKQLSSFPLKKEGNLHLVFLGRLEKSKGVLELWDIEKNLKKQKINVNWTIVGKGSLKQALLNQWDGAENISFHEPTYTEDVYKILGTQDIFVFPTTFEGTPVSILECMANGVVTITNDLPGGIRDILFDNSIGYRCAISKIDEYVSHIVYLDKNRNELRKKQLNCYEFSKRNYDIRNNADEYFKIFLKYNNFIRPIKQWKISNSRLDQKFIPNALVKLIRSL